MANYGTARLDEFCDTPYHDLKPAERRAARKHKALQANDPAWTEEAERVINDQQHLTLNRAYQAAATLNNHNNGNDRTNDTTPTLVDELAPTPQDAQYPWVAELPENLAKPARETRWKHEAEAMRRHPGLWMRLRETDQYKHAQEFATAIRNGKRTAFRPHGAYQAQNIENPRGHYTVYARYTGTKENTR